MSAEFGITLPQFELMCVIDQSSGPVVMSRLSEELHVTGSNITGVVDRLERKGLVKRFRSHIDRRVQHIRMTALGHTEFAGIAADVAVYLTEAFRDMTDDDVSGLDRLLHKASLSAAKT